MAGFIHPGHKIFTVEEVAEINLSHQNWVSSVSRTGYGSNEEGAIGLFELLKSAVRHRPDYIIVGEVRGKEAYVMFQGMAAGFPAMGTMHAGKVEDVIHRLETPPISLSPTLIETLDVVVIMVHARTKGKTARRVKEIIEIESVDTKTGVARTNKVFNWLASEDKFEYRGYVYSRQ